MDRVHRVVEEVTSQESPEALARLGAEVVLLEALPRILQPDGPEASAAVAESLAADGVAVRTRVALRRAAAGPGLELADGERVGGSHLLVAAGRTPYTAGLGLELAGVATAADGVVVDGRLRTSQPHIYAVGDCATSLRFTHVAHEQGRLAVANALGRRPRRFDPAAVPWVAFTDPELGWIGMTAVGPAGGELVAEGALAIRSHTFAGRLAQTVHAYPTWSTAVRQAAAQWFPRAADTTARPARPPQRSG
jgi:pyruvate/2-oxoglutarate dehydrogenase complex dihydrolipoamide dehydrogenase (E3) component